MSATMADPDPVEAGVVRATTEHAVSVSPYAGLASRTLAFGIDAGIINGVAFLAGLVVGAGLSVLKVPQDVQSVLFAIGGVAAVAWSIGYFVFFWSASGRTPGNRVLEIKVRMADDNRPPSPRRALLRVLLLPLSAIPLCAGFLLILVDRRRRALHDCLAGTVVVYTE